MQRVLEILLRRKGTIIASVVSTTMIVIVASLLLPPVYRVRSKVVVETQERRAPTVSMKAGANASLLSSRGAGSIEKILAAPSIFVDKVVSRLQIRDTQGNLMTADRMVEPGLVTKLGSAFSPSPYMCFERSEETGLLDIVTTSADPREAMMIANCVAEVIVNETRTEISGDFERAQAALSRQIEGLKTEYTSNLRAIADYQKSQESVDVETEAQLAAKKTGELLKQKEETLVALAEVRAKLGELKKKSGQAGEETLSLSELSNNEHVNAIKDKLTELRLELAEAGADLTEEHPRVQALTDQIITAEEELKKELAVYRSPVPRIAELEGKILSLGARIEAIDQNIERHARSMGDLPDQAFKQASFDIELKAGPEAYSALLDSRHTLTMAEVRSLSGLEIVEKAKIPATPVFPKKGANAGVGILAGLFFGVVIAFGREYLDDTIKSADDVRALKPAATIGAIPMVEPNTLALISGRDSNDPLYESYRWIRSHLDLIDHIRNKPLQSLLVFSPGPNEGKSTTVVNLGISNAREGWKVALVDADLRRPSLDAYLGVSNEVGLSDWLQGRCRLDSVLHETSVSGLSVIPSGQPVADPGRLLALGRVGDLMSKLKTRYDLVIVDSAPFLVKADALALARWVQGTVVVLESEKTTRRALSEMMERVATIPAQPLGFVLNKCPVRRGSYSSNRYYPYSRMKEVGHMRPMIETVQEEVVQL